MTNDELKKELLDAYKRGYEEALNACVRNGGEAWARSMFANNAEHIKPQQAGVACPLCGSDCNERDELEKAEREIERLRATPVHQAEPVAWVRPDQLQKARQAPFLCRVSPTKDAPDLMPMFLHPPAAEVQRLRDALAGLLEHYVLLVNSGDAGSWDPEVEPVVIASRSALDKP